MIRAAAAALAALALALVPARPAEAEPRRIVSLNLCADQLLVALADPGQIVALSPHAADPSISAVAEAARRHRRTGGTAEEALALAPDLVLLGPRDRHGAERILAARGIRTGRIPVASSLDEAAAIIRHVAGLIGHPARGEALAGRLAVPAPPPAAGPAPTALPYERRGYAAGPASMIGDMLRRAGFTHAAPSLALGGFVSLEAVVAARPDVLVLGDRRRRADDQGSALMVHPALARLYPPERRLLIPDHLTVCPGPGLVEAMAGLAAARLALTP